MLAARARARASDPYGPPCSFPPLVRARGAPGELGTHPEAAPGEAPNLAPSARNGRLPWELWREKVRRILGLYVVHNACARGRMQAPLRQACPRRRGLPGRLSRRRPGRVGLPHDGAGAIGVAQQVLGPRHRAGGVRPHAPRAPRLDCAAASAAYFHREQRHAHKKVIYPGV